MQLNHAQIVSKLDALGFELTSHNDGVDVITVRNKLSKAVVCQGRGSSRDAASNDAFVQFQKSNPEAAPPMTPTESLGKQVAFLIAKVEELEKQVAENAENLDAHITSTAEKPKDEKSTKPGKPSKNGDDSTPT